MKPVPNIPPLPYPGRGTSLQSLAGFDQDLVRALSAYLSDMARRANGSLPSDGSGTMSGMLEIFNAGGGAGNRWDGRLIKLSNFAPGVFWEDRSTSAVDLYMNLDSGVLRFYRTSAGDGSDLVEIFAFDLTTKTLHLINTDGDGAELLRFATERSWAIKQRGTGGSAMLSLESLIASKQFEIRDSAGNIVATFGDLTGSDIGFNRIVRLNSGQLLFPATQVPSSNANTLDDYEEGTWTPEATFTTPGDVSMVYGTRSGRYIKIGKLVFLKGVITITPTYTTAAGELRVTGFPFTHVSGFGETTGSSEVNDAALDATTKWVNANIIAGQNQLRFVQSHDAPTNRTSIDTTNVPSGTTISILFAITFEANA